MMRSGTTLSPTDLTRHVGAVAAEEERQLPDWLDKLIEGVHAQSSTPVPDLVHPHLQLRRACHTTTTYPGPGRGRGRHAHGRANPSYQDQGVEARDDELNAIRQHLTQCIT